MIKTGRYAIYVDTNLSFSVKICHVDPAQDFLWMKMTLKVSYLGSIVTLLRDLESSWHSFTGELCEQL